jgi:hypothetical protein
VRIWAAEPAGSTMAKPQSLSFVLLGGRNSLLVAGRIRDFGLFLYLHSSIDALRE